MKVVKRDILTFQEKDFFYAIRDKVDYARIIAYAARMLLLNMDTKGYESNSTLKLVVDKMSRIFIYKGNKYYSVSFPFNVLTDGNDVFGITTYSGITIDNQVISMALSVLNDDRFKLQPSPLDYWAEATDVELKGLSFLEQVFQFEPSYIRYDHDPERENAKLHPLYHLDVNYSGYGSYKIGLNKEIISDYFEDILNISTDCAFFEE